MPETETDIAIREMIFELNKINKKLENIVKELEKDKIIEIKPNKFHSVLQELEKEQRNNDKLKSKIAELEKFESIRNKVLIKQLKQFQDKIDEWKRDFDGLAETKNERITELEIMGRELKSKIAELEKKR